MAGSAIRIAILANARTALANIARVTQSVRNLDRRSRAAAGGGTRAFTNSLQRLGRVARGATGMLRPLGKAMGVSLMGFIAVGVATGAAQVASALAAGLAAALPAVGVIPGVALLAAAAIGVLKIAMQGIADSVKAGFKAALTGSKEDPIAYQETLKNMTPAARRTVGALVSLRPALIGIRDAVQEAFFARLSGQIAGLGRIYLPLVKKNATAVAVSFNRALREIGSFAREGRTIKSISKIMATVRRSIDDLTRGLPNLVRGFLPLISVSTTFLPGLTGGFEAATKRFADFMAKAEKTGELKSMIQGGIDALKSVGKVFGSIGSIIKSVFVDANKGGEGLFAVLGTILSQVAAFLDSAEGMAAVGAVWDTLRTVGAALGAALAVVLPALGEGLKAVAPVVGVLATAISNLMIILAPLLPIIGQVAALFGEQLARVFDAMAPVLLDVGVAIAKIATALLPLIPMFADVAGAVGTMLVDAVSALLPVIEPLIATLSGSLAAVLPAITEAFAVLAPVIAQVAGVVGGALLSMVTAVAPLLPVLADAFGAIAAAVLPLVPPIAAIVTGLVSGLMPIVKKLMPVISRLAALLGAAFLKVLEALAPVFPILVDAVVRLLPPVLQLADAFLPLLPIVANLATILITAAMPAVTALVGPLIRIVEFLVPIATWAAQLAATVTTNLGPALQWLGGVLVAVAGWLGKLVDAVLWVATGIGSLPAAWTAVWGAVKTATATVVGWLTSAVAGLVGGVKRTWSRIGDLVTTARTFVSNVVNVFLGWFNWMKELPGKIIDGLLSGFQAGWHRVTEWISNAMDLIPQGVRDALGIASPSKVMANIGKHITGGLAVGIRREIPAVSRAMAAVSSAVNSGVGTAAAVKVTTAGRVSDSGAAPAAAGIVVNVSVGVGADPSEAGRKIVAAIEAWQARTGRRRLLAG